MERTQKSGEALLPPPSTSLSTARHRSSVAVRGSYKARTPSPTSWSLMSMGGLHGMTRRVGSSTCDIATRAIGLRGGGVSLYIFCGDQLRTC